MDRETRRQIEEYRRREAGPIENNLIDELVAGELDRQEFLRRAALFGLGAGTVGALLRLVGEADLALGAPAAAEQRRGGTLRVAITKPGAAIEPSRIDTVGAVGIVSIVGEYLTFTTPQGNLQPWLATSWRPNRDASVWTFQIRRGVRFHNGRRLTADDVVSTFRVLTRKESAAFSVFNGILTPEGVRKTGPYTVQFRLEQPTGAFPYLVSQTTYQGIILPATYRVGSFISAKMPATGPYRLQSYVEGRSATFVRNDAYWGGRPLLDTVRVTMFESSTPQVLALRAGQVDLVQQVSALEAAPFAGNRRFQAFSTKTANHRQFGMRTDQEKFRDPRVRRAIALTLNRPGLVRSLWRGRAIVGNDSPFTPLFPSTARDVPQRTQNLRQARQLLEAAGAENTSFTLTTWQNLEIPDYAQIIQRSARQVGIDVKLEILSGGEYYGAPPGQDYATSTPWLNREAVITDYGHRPIPNVYLTAAFKTGGEWNQSRYSNPRFDAALRSYIAAVDLQTQRRYARQMQTILLQDTPVIISYFYDWIALGSAKIRGYQPEGLGAIGLRRVWLA
ncbi:MAG TPA: ABC transporter substrate-binding protein [Gaiellaceae bacterium]|nr:ABC transporter substrate-binding protein [Gaiellaceae bacterium]